MRRLMLVVATVVLLAPAQAQQQTATDILARIRQEAAAGSQILRTVHYLSDVYGPRLTGSPNLKAAGEWSIKQMTDWGLVNAHLEPWEFGHPGWTNEKFSAHIVSPVKDSLVGEVLAWTSGTDGTVVAQAVSVIPPERPTANELTAFLDSLREKVRGAIVLVGKPVVVPVSLTTPAAREDEDGLRRRYDPNATLAGRGRGGFGNGQPPAPSTLTAAQVNDRINLFLVASGARVRLNDAGLEHGVITAFNNTSYDLTQRLPTVMLRNEDYGRIWRILADGTAVELEVTIVNRMHPDGRTMYNAIAEIPGSDKRDEVVMMGGHLDSWHAATGATDNAVGCAIMMEAARILKVLGVAPRRTIRVALWSGEEQGLLGSRAYVAEHFGTFENQKPDYAKLVAYLNVDEGTGRLRGARVFGPPAAANVVRQLFAPLRDLGVVGAIATRGRNLGGSDGTVFSSAGLSNIWFDQDPIQYDSHTHHTNLDTYERILEADVQQAAIVVAMTAYELAMRDEMLPRFAAGDIPAAPGRGN
ncbi:MAG: M20/M25/M40 family metallo-hydrolase [Vicinamibacterales bacterium]|mgnify:FL=1